jgi:hypothetical protein
LVGVDAVEDEELVEELVSVFLSSFLLHNPNNPKKLNATQQVKNIVNNRFIINSSLYKIAT